MDHVDIAASQEISSAPLVAIQVRIPFSAGASDQQSAAPTSGRLLQQSGSGRRDLYTKRSIAKPTLSRFIALLPIEKWVPDDHVACCMAPECQLPFSIFVRKHHCRACGRIFCANCSSRLLPTLVSNSTHVAQVSPSTPLPPVRMPTGSSSMSNVRVCSECFYEHQLVVVRRSSTLGASGHQRRRARGELKMFTWPLIVHIMSFLPLTDLLNASAVSSDFYFMSRDNQLWFVHNMNRWGGIADGGDILRFSAAASSNGGGGAAGSLQPQHHLATRNSVGSASSAKSATTNGGDISHHARYNFTQFLDFAKKLESARCQGLSSFSAGAKQLFSSPIKICFIGPPSVGKTLMIRKFLGEFGNSGNIGGGGALSPSSASASSNVGSSVALHPTSGFSVYSKRVSIVGGLTCEALLSIVDVAGDKRYEQLRCLCAQSCHVIVVCYSAHNKMSLVNAATQVTTLEPFLGPQPAIICGVIHDPTKKRDATSAGAEGISVRCRASIQTDNPEEIFQSAIQTLLDKLVLGSSTASPSSASSGGGSAAARSSAQALLSITSNPSVLDVLLDPK